jgi:hypothetical protein
VYVVISLTGAEGKTRKGNGKKIDIGVEMNCTRVELLIDAMSMDQRRDEEDESRTVKGVCAFNSWRGI